MKEDFDLNIQPVSSDFLCFNPSEDQFSGIHEAGKDSVVGFGYVSDFYAICIPDDDCFFVEGVIGFPKEVQPVPFLHMGFQFQNSIDVAGSGHMGFEKEDVPFKWFGDVQFSAFSVEQADEAGSFSFYQFSHHCTSVFLQFSLYKYPGFR